MLTLAASAERYSEHLLAEAIRQAARDQNITFLESQDFVADPGKGVQARIGETVVEVGSWRIMEDNPLPEVTIELEKQGKTLLFVRTNQELAGILTTSDTLRPETPAALAELKRLGVRKIELLTGDNERTAAAIAGQLGLIIGNLLPEDKIRIVKNTRSRNISSSWWVMG